MEQLGRGGGADLNNSRSQPAEAVRLTPDQVPRLQLKWAARELERDGLLLPEDAAIGFAPRPAVVLLRAILQIGANTYKSQVAARTGEDLHDLRIFADHSPASDAHAGRCIRPLTAACAIHDRDKRPGPQSSN
jgi:hypothetical protein